ncbi:MAG: DUF4404 family protein [Bacteroidota bacterium]
MSDDELRKSLEELHRKIETTNHVDEEGRELLNHLKVDIQTLLDRTESEDQFDDTSGEIARLEESVRHFEVTHPSLTAAISQLLNILNNAGI